MTFHTLERVKADTFETESEDRAFQEAAIFACADAVLASCDVEADSSCASTTPSRRECTSCPSASNTRSSLPAIAPGAPIPRHRR